MGSDAAEVFEIVGDPADEGPFFVTCDHATNLMHDWTPTHAEEAMVADHWGWDIGAADVTRELVARTGSCGVLSRFSRLICDPNRESHLESFIVREIEGHLLSFNRDVDEHEHERRRVRYFDAYHGAVDRLLTERMALATPVRLCAIHSFTPTWRGEVRRMEVGVLFDEHEDLAREVAASLADEDFVAALNEPYSGRGHPSLTYSAERHGRAHRIPHLELEVRQDLIDTPEKARAVAERLARALDVYAAEARPQAPAAAVRSP